jgi:glycosyltransferase involved in cell wall biosynthesis
VRKAIVTCNSPYGGLPVTAHYYARWLARTGFDVLFLCAPISPFHLLNLADAAVRRRLRWWSKGVREEGNGIASLVPSAVVTPRDFWPLSSLGFYENWPTAAIPSLRKQIQAWSGGPVDYLYLEAPIFLPLMDLVRPRLSIYRLPDKLGSFHAKIRPLVRAATALAQRVDLTVYASSTFRQQVEELRPRASAHLPNGVELDAFALRPGSPEPSDLEALSRPRIIFAGEIGSRIDLPLIQKIATQYPQASVVLIGCVSRRISRTLVREVFSAANVYHLGEKSYESLARYLSASDVGIVPFKFDQTDPFIAHSNPLKVYQYLACGLPVLATRTSALESIAAPIDLAATAGEFMLKLGQRLATGSTAVQSAARQAYAQQHSFEAQLEALFRAFPEHDPRKLL